MIPKKIHYIWLGGKRKSKLTELCINTWKRNLPGYTIIEWNESNLPLTELLQKNKFLKKCYALKLWAFVSDYIRLYILLNEGGIYLDTDVEVIQSFDSFLSNDVFLGYEVDNYIGTAVIGAEPKNEFIKELLSFYEKRIFEVDYFNNPIIFKKIIEDDSNSFNNLNIYSMSVFSPYDPACRDNKVIGTKDTCCIHWYTGDWNISLRGYVFLTTKHIKPGFKKVFACLRKTVGYFKQKKKK